MATSLETSITHLEVSTLFFSFVFDLDSPARPGKLPVTTEERSTQLPSPTYLVYEKGWGLLLHVAGHELIHQRPPDP